MNQESIDIEQIKGSLYGFFVGDALGVPVEFIGRETLKNKPITDSASTVFLEQPKVIKDTLLFFNISLFLMLLYLLYCRKHLWKYLRVYR